MTTFKIDLLVDGEKRKHKLYDSQQAYERYFNSHTESLRYNRGGGVVGYINGKIDKVRGIVGDAIMEQWTGDA